MKFLTKVKYAVNKKLSFFGFHFCARCGRKQKMMGLKGWESREDWRCQNGKCIKHYYYR